MDEIKEQVLNVLTMMWQRKWWALGGIWAVGIIGWIIVASIPNVYESKARIYVDTETLLKPLLQGLSAESDVKSQALLMQSTLLTRPNIERVIRDTDLNLEITDDKSMETLVLALMKNVKIMSNGDNLFEISYRNADAKLSQKIVQAFLNIFVENNLGDNRIDSQNARGFIEAQLKQYQDKIQEIEKKIADFKGRNAIYIGNQTYSTQLDQTRTDFQTITAELGNLKAALADMQEQEKTLPPFVNGSGTGDQKSGPRGTLASLEDRIHQTEESLDQLMLQYTPEHPDVVSTTRILKKLKEEHKDIVDKVSRGEIDDSIIVEQVPNPVIDEIRKKIAEQQTAIAVKENDLNRLTGQLEQLQKVSIEAPQVEAEYSDLVRDLGLYEKNYQDLLAKRESVAIGQAAVATQTNQFRIIDPPTVPLTPVAPLRFALYLAVILVAIGGGGLVSYLKVELENTFVSLAQLREEYAQLVIGSVSMLDLHHEQVDEKKMQIVFVALCILFLLISLILSATGAHFPHDVAKG